ncbi:MAG: hypothetical protein ACM3VT_05630 [Solirubrobacterales bacterium]
MTTRRWAILVGGILLGAGLLWLAFYEPIEEGRCRLIRKKADPENPLVGLAIQLVDPLDHKPHDVQDLSPGFARPCYHQIKSGGRLISMVVDLSDSPRLCLDTDADGVLSEEHCFPADMSDGAWQFGPIPPIGGAGSGSADGRFYVRCSRPNAPSTLLTRPASFRTGRLRLDGETHRVAVADGDYDGAFRSILSLPLDRPERLPASDVFGIDLNHNGTFEISLGGQSEVMPLGRLVKIRDAYYALDVAPDGTSLALSRTEPQLGTLAIEPNDVAVALRLWSDAAEQCLAQGRTWQLPAGKYKAIHATLTKTDTSGHVWTVSSNTSSRFTRLGPLEYFTIEPGITTSIRIGPPFVLKTDVVQTAAAQVSIGMVLIGCAGEEYWGIQQQEQRRPSPPALRIVDEKGTVLETGTFEYG